MSSIEPGMIVLAEYRMPSSLQPWIHGFHFGVVEAPGTDPREWNGHNSEAVYCETAGLVRVRYPFGVQHEPADALLAVDDATTQLPHAELVRRFLGEPAHARLVKASGSAN